MQSAIVYHPVLPLFAQRKDHSSPQNHGDATLRSAAIRSPENALEEAVGLAAAIDLQVLASEIITINKPRPATLFGTGKLEEMKASFKNFDHPPTVIIIDGGLSPVQHRNLENALEVKVLDRTALILEIFGSRARTKEGRLQVELAHLTYQRSRLVRSWTHLERQRGGAGFLGGPGERQIESDRRVLAEKIVKLKKKLESVKRTRSLQRAKRKQAPQPVVALVGYANAGKSTLFNKLTKSTVQAQDLLFATLDPTMRSVILPSGQEVIFSDTVGFISELPTQLVAAFRATLEEVLEANLIVHVRDISHGDSEAQRQDVLAVLKELGVATGAVDLGNNERPVIEALNKIDLLNADEVSDIDDFANASLNVDFPVATASEPVRVSVSAVSGDGIEKLSKLVDDYITADRILYECHLPLDHGAARAFLHAQGDVINEIVEDDVMKLEVRLTDKVKGQFEQEFSLKIIDNHSPQEEQVPSFPYQP